MKDGTNMVIGITSLLAGLSLWGRERQKGHANIDDGRVSRRVAETWADSNNALYGIDWRWDREAGALGAYRVVVDGGEPVFLDREVLVQMLMREIPHRRRKRRG